MTRAQAAGGPARGERERDDDMRGKPLALRTATAAGGAAALAAAALLLAACLGEGEDGGRGGATAAAGGGGKGAPSSPTVITLVAAGRAAGGEAPRVAVLVDGEPVGEAVVRAEHGAGEWETHEFRAAAPPRATLGVRYLNDGGERDLWVRRVEVGGAELPLDRATYLRNGRDPLPGQERMRWGGELRFEPLAGGGAP